MRSDLLTSSCVWIVVLKGRMGKPSLPLSIQKCPVPCFQPIAAARGGPLFARDGCSYTTPWSSCLWRTQLLWRAGLGLRQELPGLCSLLWGPTPEHLVLWRCHGALFQAHSNAGAEQLGEFSPCPWNLPSSASVPVLPGNFGYPD